MYPQQQPMPPAPSGPRPLAGLVQVVIALAALGFAVFAVFEVGGEVKGPAKPFFIVPGILVALLAILPARAAMALFRGTPDVQRRTDVVRVGCGFPLLGVLGLGVFALVRSAAAGEPLTEVLPYVGLLAVTAVLIWVVAPALASRGAGPR